MTTRRTSIGHQPGERDADGQHERREHDGGGGGSLDRRAPAACDPRGRDDRQRLDHLDGARPEHGEGEHDRRAGHLTARLRPRLGPGRRPSQLLAEPRRRQASTALSTSRRGPQTARRSTLRRCETRPTLRPREVVDADLGAHVALRVELEQLDVPTALAHGHEVVAARARTRRCTTRRRRSLDVLDDLSRARRAWSPSS